MDWLRDRLVCRLVDWMIALPSQPQPPSTQTPYHTTCGLIGIYIYIYIYIYTRFAYGTLRCLWSRTKHSSKQCSDSEGQMSKSELTTVDSKAQFEPVQRLRRKDKLVRTAFPSAQTLQNWISTVFRALRRSRAQFPQYFDRSDAPKLSFLCILDFPWYSRVLTVCYIIFSHFDFLLSTFRSNC